MYVFSCSATGNHKRPGPKRPDPGMIHLFSFSCPYHHYLWPYTATKHKLFKSDTGSYV